MKHIVISINDEVGIVANISETLAEKEINIERITVEGWGDRGIVILTTDQHQKAMESLKDADFDIITYEGIVLELRDQPGELAKVAAKLRDANINIKSLNVIDTSNGYTRVAIATDKPQKTETLLTNEGLM